MSVCDFFLNYWKFLCAVDVVVSSLAFFMGDPGSSPGSDTQAVRIHAQNEVHI